MGDSKKPHSFQSKQITTVQDSQRLDLCLSAGNLAWWEMYLPSGKVICNENKLTMLGYSSDTCKQTDYHFFMNLVHPDDYEKVMKAMRDHIEGKKPLYEIDYRIKTKQGTYKWFHDRGSVVWQDEGTNSLIVKGVVFDITELKNTEEELRDIQKKLEDIVSQRTKDLQNQIQQRKKAEEYTKRHKQYLRDIIDSASEIIISFDMFHRVLMWNKTAEHLTGFKTIEVLNRSVGKLSVFQNPKDLEDYIKLICSKGASHIENISFITKDNNKKIIRGSGTKIQGENNECIGAMIIGRDITKEMEIHGKLLDGCSYLIAEKNNKKSIDLFLNLLLLNKKGLFITRGSPALVESMIPSSKNLTTVLLRSESVKHFKSINTLEDIEKEIRQFSKEHKNGIILLDGIHYLLTKFSFDEFITMFYTINDSIAKHKALLLVRIDPSTIDPNQYAILENEIQMLPSKKIEGVIIDDEAFNMLTYIYEQNQQNATVSFKKIISKFKIAYMTAANKIKMLEEKGLLITKKEGKYRTVYITNNGKKMLHKRQNA
ncbi:MAG: PAS domain S-box protein [Thermoplasmatota archaeon]